MKYLALCVAIVLVAPTSAFAMRINEIAWKGTVISANDEWIELYNDESSPVALDGWELRIDGGLTVPLSGTLAPGEYYLLERTDDQTVPGVQANKLYTGTLPNTAGTVLKLLHTNTLVDQVLYIASAWTSAESMQYTAGSWIVATQTPKALNAATSSIPEEQNTPEDTNPDHTEQSSQKKPEPASKTATDLIEFTHIPSHIRFQIPQSVYRQVETVFSAEVIFNDMRREKGFFTWNMGDGTVIHTTTTNRIVHTYQYPGTYMLSLAYRNSETDTAPILTHTEPVVVTAVPLTLSIIDTSAIVINNTNATQVDISGWSIHNSGQEVRIPPLTYIAPKSSVTFPGVRIGGIPIRDAALVAPGGAIIASPQAVPTPISASRYRVQSTASTTEPVSVVAPIDITKEEPQVPAQKRTNTKVVLGVGSIIGIGCALLLLERFMARREHSDQSVGE